MQKRDTKKPLSSYEAIARIIKSSDRELLEYIAISLFNMEYRINGYKAIDMVKANFK